MDIIYLVDNMQKATSISNASTSGSERRKRRAHEHQQQQIRSGEFGVRCSVDRLVEQRRDVLLAVAVRRREHHDAFANGERIQVVEHHAADEKANAASVSSHNEFAYVNLHTRASEAELERTGQKEGPGRND